METTERIVEAYVRYVKGWATIPNIKCDGQYEVDLLAVDPASLKRFHIESGVSIGSGFSKLTAKPFSDSALKERVKGPEQRRTLDFFVKRKFGAREVRSKLAEYGFREGNYTCVIVSWGWTEGAASEAERQGIELWDFRRILQEIAQAFGRTSRYFTDDTLRTLQLFLRAAAQGSGTTNERGRGRPWPGKGAQPARRR